MQRYGWVKAWHVGGNGDKPRPIEGWLSIEGWLPAGDLAAPTVPVLSRP